MTVLHKHAQLISILTVTSRKKVEPVCWHSRSLRVREERASQTSPSAVIDVSLPLCKPSGVGEWACKKKGLLPISWGDSKYSCFASNSTGDWQQKSCAPQTRQRGEQRWRETLHVFILGLSTYNLTVWDDVDKILGCQYILPTLRCWFENSVARHWRKATSIACKTRVGIHIVPVRRQAFTMLKYYICFIEIS